MASTRKVRVLIVGLNFGEDFLPIYQQHPDVEHVGIVDPNLAGLEAVGAKFGVERRHADLKEALKSREYDAVHLVSPIPLHFAQTMAVLKAGLHCACAVPMATSIPELRKIVAAQRKSGRNYMMMETAVYTRQFLYARELHATGRLGRIQLLRGAHYQDMENWPGYWRGLPPMHYATHAVAPGLAIADTHATAVTCLGSGAMREELQAQYGNPYPVETALFELAARPLAMEVTRSLFQTARGNTESFWVYGEKMSVEWPQVEADKSLVVFTAGELPNPQKRGKPTTAERVDAPDRADLLPAPVARFTTAAEYKRADNGQPYRFGGGHHGSHPHLVHELIRSIVEERSPRIDARRSAQWTAAGLCAHDSAMKGGKRVTVPDFA